MNTPKRSMAGQWLLVLAAVLLMLPAAYAELTATVDATEVTTDQSLNYTLSTTTGTGDPDFSELQLDFDILGQSTFSQTQSHNGKIIQNLSWRLQLLPKREGTYTIPAMTVAGETSQPIEITVSRPREVTGADIGDFHVDVSVDNERPFVQAQVIYTIRVYHAINFLDGSLSAPEVPGIRVEGLGEDRVYQENRNGRIYRVLERRFALFPQNSGEVQLAGVVLNANVPTSSGNRGFFAPRQPIRRRSAEIRLDVQPRPAENQTLWWLPASDVQLEARWEGESQTAYVGESITRTLILRASGVDSTTLPELVVPAQDKFRVYADQPELTSQATPQGLQSQRIEKWALIPQVAGELTLPSLEVPWFNTATGAFELAVLPAATLQVQPARNAVTGEIQVEQPIPAQTASPQVIEPASDSETSLQPASVATSALSDRVGWWRAMAILAVGGWLCTLIAWWLMRRRHRQADEDAPLAAVRPAVSFKDLEHAGSGQDHRAFAATLIRWAQAFWADAPPGSLVAMAQRIEREAENRSMSAEHRTVASALSIKLRQLDAQLYAGSNADPGSALAAVDLPPIVKNLRQYADTADVQIVTAGTTALPSL